jgi:hypothetical protein
MNTTRTRPVEVPSAELNKKTNNLDKFTSSGNTDKFTIK